MGAARRAKEERKRAEKEAKRMAKRYEAAMRQQQEAMAQMMESARPPELPEPPKPVDSTLKEGAGIRTAASARKSIRKTAAGAASLRIPLNVGGAGGTGLNIG